MTTRKRQPNWGGYPGRPEWGGLPHPPMEGDPGYDPGEQGDHEEHPPAPRRAKGESGANHGIRSGAWLDRQEFTPLVWLVPNLIHEGFTILAGAPKIGKSVILLQIGLGAAAGGKLFGEACSKSHVLYLALEDSDRRMQQRCRELLNGQPIPADFQYKLKCQPGKLISDIRDWLKFVPDDEPVLVMVDTLGKVLDPSRPGETTYDRDYRLSSELKSLSDNRSGTAILASHHNRKAKSDDYLDMVSGTAGLTGGTDATLILTRTRPDPDGLIQFTSREADDAEYAVLLERPRGWVLDGADLTESASAAFSRHGRKSEETDKFITFINEHPEGVKAADVANALNMSRNSAGVTLNRQAELGRIRRISRGTFGPIGKLNLGR